MHDIQNEHDSRGIAIDQVGITELRYPVTFTDGRLHQATIATFDITVELQAERRGTHMSRMVEVAQDHLTNLDPSTLPITLKAAADHLDAPAITINANLSVGIETPAPVTGRVGWQIHDVTISGTFNGDTALVTIAVTSDITSLCPCSKAISDYGAHNQRSKVTLAVTGTDDNPYPFSITEMITLIRASGSAPVYPLIKRPDERHITMQAYDQPAFVEDIARDLSQACRQVGLTHRIHIRNIESIHSHDAVASVAFEPPVVR